MASRQEQALDTLRQPPKRTSGHTLWAVTVIFQLQGKTFEFFVIPTMTGNVRHIAMPGFGDALGQTVEIAAFLDPKVQVSGSAGGLQDGTFFVFVIQPAVEIRVSRHKHQRHVFITGWWGSKVGFTHPAHHFIQNGICCQKLVIPCHHFPRQVQQQALQGIGSKRSADFQLASAHIIEPLPHYIRVLV